MRIAIMQPYFIPYIGYFQLINAVDSFIFYDDVNYINRGWINRNNLLVNGKKKLVTLPCLKASQNKLINEIELKREDKAFDKILKMVEMSYKKAPFFADVFPLFTAIMRFENNNLALFTANSIMKISEFIGIDTVFAFSSKKYRHTRGMDKADRLIEITKQNKSNNYINPIGGKEIYSKEYFLSNKIQLEFLKSKNISYHQFKNDFEPWLSMLDVLMFNSIERTREFLNEYELI